MKKLFLIPLIIIVVSGLIFTGCPAPAPTPAPPAPPIKIGIMYPLTGPITLTGEMFVRGTKFAFEQAGYEVAGRKIEVIVEDTAGLADMALDKAKKLVEHDKVCMIIGPLTGGTKLAIAPYMSKMRVPQLISNSSPWAITKFEWSLMIGGTEYQCPSAMGRYAYDEMGFRKVTVLTSEALDARAYLSGFMDGFKKRGGQVVQEQYAPFACPDFAPYLVALKDADAVVAWAVGAASIRLITQYHEFGIRKRMPMVGGYMGSFMERCIIRALPPEVAEAMMGEHTSTLWNPLIGTDASKQFSKAWRERFGFTPETSDGIPYASGEAALEALKATGGDTTPEKLRQAILAFDYEGLMGHVHLDPETRFAITDAVIVKIDKIEGEYVLVPVYTYKDVPPGGL